MSAPAKRKVLVVEDDVGLQKQLRWCLDPFEVLIAGTRGDALAELRRHEPAVVLQDLGLPPDPAGVSEGMATLREILSVAPYTKIIVVTGKNEREHAVRAVAEGAYDFYQKPIDTQVLALVVERAHRLHALEEENRRLAQRQDLSPLEGTIAASDVMRRVCRMIEKVAPTSATVLLLGESGTGKELLARALHSLSTRKANPFVAINCAAIPDALLEAELFGHEKGAFTGAIKQTRGKIEMAESGTLFLDEIGDMPPGLQAKMLRFLQERVVERVGGREQIPVDVRVISATNRDLRAGIADGTFRQDLFYRLSEVIVEIPPLRDREGDGVVIAQRVLSDCARRHGRVVQGFAPEAIAAIEAYAWPGNIRELENRINSAVIMAEGRLVTADDLGLTAPQTGLEFLNLRVARQQAESQAIRRALAIAGGNLSRTAELLGITRPTLYDLIQKNGLSVADERAREG